MSTKKTSKMATDTGECLKKAVREEFRKKALLGQYVIISRDGKSCRIPAKEALEIADGIHRTKGNSPKRNPRDKKT